MVSPLVITHTPQILQSTEECVQNAVMGQGATHFQCHLWVESEAQAQAGQQKNVGMCALSKCVCHCMCSSICARARGVAGWKQSTRSSDNIMLHSWPAVKLCAFREASLQTDHILHIPTSQRRKQF